MEMSRLVLPQNLKVSHLRRIRTPEREKAGKGSLDQGERHGIPSSQLSQLPPSWISRNLPRSTTAVPKFCDIPIGGAQENAEGGRHPRPGTPVAAAPVAALQCLEGHDAHSGGGMHSFPAFLSCCPPTLFCIAAIKQKNQPKKHEKFIGHSKLISEQPPVPGLELTLLC